MTTDHASKAKLSSPSDADRARPAFCRRVICNVSDADRGYLAGADNYLWQSLVLRKHYGTCSMMMDVSDVDDNRTVMIIEL